jgi:hypothetical protein
LLQLRDSGVSSLSLCLSFFLCENWRFSPREKKTPENQIGFCFAGFVVVVSFFEIYLILHFLLGFQGVICLAEQNSKTAD